jgi:hypothetical protein
MQEKIERYKAEQQRAQEEAARLESEARLRIAKEKIPPLLEALKQLHCEELLTQIRDEVWKLGEVATIPDITTITSDTPIVAKTTLWVEWPHFVAAGSSGFGDWEKTWGDHLETYEETLSIILSYGFEERGLLPPVPKLDGEIYIHVDSSVSKCPHASLRATDTDALLKVEERLVIDCIERQQSYELGWSRPPYNQTKLKAEDGIVKAIIQRGFTEAPQYLLNRARERQREAPKSQEHS